MNVRWREQAVTELRQQFDRIRVRDPYRADWERECVRNRIAQLSSFPEFGRLFRGTGLRALIVAETPFIVVYAVQDREIVILRFFHYVQDR